MITIELNNAIKKTGKVNKLEWSICISTRDYIELLNEMNKLKLKKYKGFDLVVSDTIEYGDIYITKIKSDEIRKQLLNNLN